MQATIERVCKRFKIDGNFHDFTEEPGGLINNTYSICCDGKRYTVQKINKSVFKDPLAVMRNIDLVTEHIRAKAPDETLHFHHTEEGNNYVEDGDAFWRLYTYRPGYAPRGLVSHDVLTGCGRAFGIFYTRLDDFDATKLAETIPGFHNPPKRYEKLCATIARDELGRAAESADVIAKIEALTPDALKISTLGLPLRVTHNDTKNDNVLLDENNNPVCVIDLDTVMPGLLTQDFGEAVVYAASNAGRLDGPEEKATINMERFRAFAEGFVSATAGILTEAELENLPLGAVTASFELAVRFTDDYLSGDTYFRTFYPGENLARARCEATLALDMVKHLPEMNAIVREIYDRTRAGA